MVADWTVGRPRPRLRVALPVSVCLSRTVANGRMRSRTVANGRERSQTVANDRQRSPMVADWTVGRPRPRLRAALSLPVCLSVAVANGRERSRTVADGRTWARTLVSQVAEGFLQARDLGVHHLLQIRLVRNTLNLAALASDGWRGAGARARRRSGHPFDRSISSGAVLGRILRLDARCARC